MKKFYGNNNMTYLYFQNFYHPLNENLEKKKNITIYLRNLNIFREYIPQNIVTKYYNLHLFQKPSDFPQLMVSLPFAGVTRKTSTKPYIFEMEGYNYFLRDENGDVLDDDADSKEITKYELKLDTDIDSLRPPRNFWRLNFLDLNNILKMLFYIQLLLVKNHRKLNII